MARRLLALTLSPSALLPATAERAMVASGDMETWMQAAFGGDSFVLMPTVYTPLVAGAVPPGAVQDPGSGKWYVCPEFGYRMASCGASCSAPPMRCRTEFNLVFRWVGKSGLRRGGFATVYPCPS